MRAQTTCDYEDPPKDIFWKPSYTATGLSIVSSKTTAERANIGSGGCSGNVGGYTHRLEATVSNIISGRGGAGQLHLYTGNVNSGYHQCAAYEIAHPPRLDETYFHPYANCNQYSSTSSMSVLESVRLHVLQ